NSHQGDVDGPRLFPSGISLDIIGGNRTSRILMANREPCLIYIANTSWYLFNFRLSLMKCMIEDGWRVIGVAPPDHYSKLLMENYIHYYPLPISRRGMNPFSDLLSFQRLHRIFQKEKPILVHNFTIKPVIYGSLAARSACVPAVVNSITGLGYT